MSRATTPSPTTSYPPTSPERTFRKTPIESIGRDFDAETPSLDVNSGLLSTFTNGEADEGPDGSLGGLEGEDKATSFIWLLVSSAAICGLLFGYDTGVISGTLVVIRGDLGTPLSDWQKEMITSATTFGALLGGLGAGPLSDYTGRKPVIGLASVVFIIGALLQAVSHAVSTMVGGRFIVGLGVGLASCIAPLYIAELSPSKLRGRLVTINVVAICLGQVIAYAVGAVFGRVEGGWRWMVGLGATPAIVQLLSLTILPESPRFLLLRSRNHEATIVLSKVYPMATKAEMETKVRGMTAAIRHSVYVDQTTTWLERLRGLMVIGRNRRALIIGSGLQASQQLCGFNTLMYYSASIFAALGFRNATAVGIIIASANFAFTLVALYIIDSVGRRRTLLYTVPVMTVALLGIAVFFHRQS